jgi:hypothetical protein
MVLFSLGFAAIYQVGVSFKNLIPFWDHYVSFVDFIGVIPHKTWVIFGKSLWLVRFPSPRPWTSNHPQHPTKLLQRSEVSKLL